VLGYFGLAFLAMTVTSRQSFVMLGVTAYDAFNFFPVIGLQNYLGGFDINFLTMALVHFAAVCLLSFVSYKRFMKRDF
ncbi:MAG: hypothetical protein K2G26_06365, partial [Clostridia bacterium]|nr:hypothetical protein [Clostridia bacterium]